MPFQDLKYKRNIAVLKDYGGKYKITVHNILRTSGIVCDDEVKPEKCSVNEDKLDNNISRAKAAIFELAFCNPWEFFFTATIDKTKYDRYDLEAFYKAFSHWLRNYNNRKETSIRYLIIPEQHKDGAWHLHGFMMGLPLEHLTLFSLKDKIPNHISLKLKSGEKVYKWEPYQKKFGFCDFEFIGNHEAVSKYVTKYITKDLSKCVSDVGAHMYYCSKGLNRATVVKHGKLVADLTPDYSNDYVSVYWFNADSIDLDSLRKFILTKREVLENDGS